MKSIFAYLLLLSSIAARAQDVFSNKTNMALQKVIEDYPNKFRNIIGNKITSNSHVTDYQSKVDVPGAMNSVITQHNNSKSEVYSWKT